MRSSKPTRSRWLEDRHVADFSTQRAKERIRVARERHTTHIGREHLPSPSRTARPEFPDIPQHFRRRRGCSAHVSRGHLEPAIASRSNHEPCASSYGFGQSNRPRSTQPNASASGATLPIELSHLNDSSTRSHSTFRVPQIEAKQCSSASSAPALSDRDARARRPLRWN
jgi:hypothetical protein